MFEYKTKRIVSIIFSIIIIISAIAGLVYVTRLLFFSGSIVDNSQIVASEQSLVSLATDRSVTMTVRGEIVSNEDFRSYQIQITPSTRTLTTYRGYIGDVINTVSIANNIPAYEQFVYALNRANFMKGVESTGGNSDLRGICATGKVYAFNILRSNVSEKQLWSSSCSSARGSLSANLDQITKLFTAQIPDSKKIISEIW